MSLFKQHAKTEAVSVAVWTVMVWVSIFFCVALYAGIRGSASLADLEKAFNSAGLMRSIAGGNFSAQTAQGWLTMYGFGPMFNVPYAIFIALFVAGMVTREMDRRTIEFVLAQPVSRAQLLLSRWSVMAVSLVAVHLAHFLGVWSGMAYLGEPAQLGRYLLALTNSLLVYLFLGSLMLAVSILIDDYGRGAGALLGIGLGLSIFHMGTSDATGALKTLRGVLPFGLYDPMAILSKGTVPWGHLAVLSAGALLFLWLALWLFDRKQIAV